MSSATTTNDVMRTPKRSRTRSREAHARDRAEPRAHLLHDDQRDEDDDEHPEELVAVARARRRSRSRCRRRRCRRWRRSVPGRGCLGGGRDGEIGARSERGRAGWPARGSACGRLVAASRTSGMTSRPSISASAAKPAAASTSPRFLQHHVQHVVDGDGAQKAPALRRRPGWPADYIPRSAQRHAAARRPGATVDRLLRHDVAHERARRRDQHLPHAEHAHEHAVPVDDEEVVARSRARLPACWYTAAPRRRADPVRSSGRSSS